MAGIKWYWIVIGVVAAVVIGYVISKSMGKKGQMTSTTKTSGDSGTSAVKETVTNTTEKVVETKAA